MKDLAKYLGKFLADGIDRTHDAGLPMDFTAKGLTSVIKIGLGNYESKLKASHAKLKDTLQLFVGLLEHQGSFIQKRDIERAKQDLKEAEKI